jgi:hypothetical protein
MSGSLASRTAAIIDAAITSVEANRSVIRFLFFHYLGPFLFLASDSPPHLAHFSPPLLDPWGLATSSWDSRPWKMSASKYRRLNPQSGHSETILEPGKVWAGAGIFSWQPLQAITNGWMPGCGDVKHKASIGESKAKCFTTSQCAGSKGVEGNACLPDAQVPPVTAFSLTHSVSQGTLTIVQSMVDYQPPRG